MLDPGRLLPSRLRDDVYEPARRDLRNAAARARLARGRKRPTVGETILLSLKHWVLWLDCLRQARHYISRPRVQEPFTMLRYHLRHALRLLWRDKTLTAAAVLTLALGLGANVAVFSVVEAVLLRPLPYPRADELVLLRHRDARTGVTKAFIAQGDLIDLAARQQVFERLDAYGNFQSTLSTPDGPLPVRGLSATPGLFQTLEATVAAGRAFDATDGRPGTAPVMMLGHQVWVSQFGSDPGVIGRTLRLGNADRQVIGVAPAGFRFPPGAAADVVLPIALPATAPAERKSGWLFAVGRLKPGVSLDQSLAQLTALSTEMEQAHPTQNQGSVYYARSLRDELVGASKPALLLMLAAVVLVLLVACANVANLLLARAINREPEMALRSTLGAGRARLALQLFSESLVLGGAGLTAALIVAYFGVPALVALVPPSVVVPGLDAAGLNLTVLGFAIGAMFLTTVAFGLIGLATTGGEKGRALASITRAGVGRKARRWSSSLVVVEIAFAAVLMVGGGLVLHSFAKLLAVDPGFETGNVLMVDVRLPPARYETVAARQAFYQQAFESVGASRDVVRAGAGVVVPLTGNNWSSPFERADRRVPAGQRPPDVGWQSASGGFFEALQIPLKSGRLFNAGDVPGGAPVVIISDAVERQFFNGESAVGKRIVSGNTTAEIVGVVGSIRRSSLEDDLRADLYFPFEQAPSGAVTLFVRTQSDDPRSVLPDIQARLRRIEPAISVGRVTTLEDVSRESIAVSRLAVWLLGVFAIVSLSLAAVGVYGVLAYQIRQRTREIGTRVALGATRQSIVWMILRDAGVLVSLGLAIGLSAGVAAAQGLGALLFDVPVADPLTLTATTATLFATMTVASYLPARRAASIDPARTLRS
jgi:putative ABC transport system permease protein